MLILTVSGLNVLQPVLAQGPVSWLTVNNPTSEPHLVSLHEPLPNRSINLMPLYRNKHKHVDRPSKSYVTPPRWRGLGNGSTPVSHHSTTRLRRVDENVDLAKLGGCARLSLTWGLGCPVGVGWVGPGMRGWPCWSLGSCTGKYLDPVGNRDRCGPQNPAHGGTKISGTVLMACRCKGSRVTWQLAVQFKMCWCKASWTKYTIGGLWLGVV